MPIRFRMSLIMGQIDSKHPELFAYGSNRTRTVGVICP